MKKIIIINNLTNHNTAHLYILKYNTIGSLVLKKNLKTKLTWLHEYHHHKHNK